MDGKYFEASSDMSSVKKLANAVRQGQERREEREWGRAYECGVHDGALEGENEGLKEREMGTYCYFFE